VRRDGIRALTRFAIDAGTLVEIVSGTQGVSPHHQLVAPRSIRSKALNLLLGRVRSGQLTEGGALQVLERLTELRVRLLDDRVSRRTAWEIAQERGWDTVDLAEYLAVTRLQADALIASDPLLTEMAAGVVALAPLAALFAD
jgi:hypothetical protein